MILNHIGIAVKSIEAQLKIWHGLLGLELEQIKEVKDQMVKVALLKVGDTRIELIEPTDQASTVNKFIERRGEGLHHLCFQVEDIETALARIKENGIALIDEKPRKGADAEKIAFIHPKGTAEVLIELCEKPRPPQVDKKGV
jgi:methylmalonyl-CoA/ethylmalonyl-CoA epimerase